MVKKLLAAVALVALLPAAANAAIIYQQGNISTGDRGAYQYSGQILADDFVAGASGNLSNATWTGSYYGAANNSGIESFTLNIYGAGATPGALLYSSVGIASIVASATRSYFDYSLDLSGPLLTAGTAYWVAIYSNDSPSNYAWANSFDGTATGAFTTDGGVSWFDLTGDQRSNHVFALNTSNGVPEPGTLALLALGVLAFGATRQRKA